MQIFLTLFFVFGLFSDGLSWGADVLSLAPKTNEWVEDYDSIVLKELQRQGLIKGTILKKKAIVPRNSTQASRLLFIKTRLLNGEDISYVVKENIAFEDSYEEEKKLIEDKTISSYQKVINNYSKTHGVKLPELISYHSATKVQVKGHTIRLTIMSKARGDTLADIEDALKIIDTENTPPFTEEQAITMGTAIGKQMGHLTRAFFERNRSILFHNDTGPQNFMYDPKKKQMYWIDLGGIDTTQYATNNPLSYLAFEGGMIQTIWKSFFLVPPSSSTQDFDNLWKIDKAHNMSLKNLVTSEGINVLKK
ncbi:MAG: hypothetical protein K2X98_04615, partial [Alphaproteobacteria bacterium]|nr:hypothetical protein [Alphaproteobacteria bacterium]